jgi:DNA repair exonuclease SbcCD nuclease subunit
MRILHVSDFHFGRHNEDLLENLKTRVSALPTVTGQ